MQCKRLWIGLCVIGLCLSGTTKAERLISATVPFSQDGMTMDTGIVYHGTTSLVLVFGTADPVMPGVPNTISGVHFEYDPTADGQIVITPEQLLGIAVIKNTGFDSLDTPEWNTLSWITDPAALMTLQDTAILHMANDTYIKLGRVQWRENIVYFDYQLMTAPQASSVPEPATLLLLGFGIFGLLSLVRKRHLKWMIVLVVSATMLISAGNQSVLAQSKTMNREALINAARSQGTVRVLVELTVPDIDRLLADSAAYHVIQPGEQPADAALQADARLASGIASTTNTVNTRLSGMSYSINHTYKSMPYLALSVSEQALAALEAQPEVIWIAEDRPMPLPPLPKTDVDIPKGSSPSTPPTETPVESSTPNQTDVRGLMQSTELIDATSAWKLGYTGAGWYVAILDTGIRSDHQFFAGKSILEACFSVAAHCPNGKTSMIGAGAARHYPRTYEGYDHGTHVAGIAAGKTTTRQGVAKDANIVAVQVFSKVPATGCPNTGYRSPCVQSYSSDQIAGLDYVYSLRNLVSVAAINMSLGGGWYNNQTTCDNDNTAKKTAIDNLRAVGIATVISSGNDGYCDGISAPACISSAIAVGAMTKSGSEAFYSNWHPTLLDLFAPGSAITSATGASTTSYAAWNGTSMAAPHVTGAFALLRQSNPSATVSTLLSALETTGVPISTTCNINPGKKSLIHVKPALISLCPECVTNLVCANAVKLTRGVAYKGTTVGGTHKVDTYPMALPRSETGSERVHKIYLPAAGRITATLSGMTADLDVAILNACDAKAAGSGGDVTATYWNWASAPGMYYVVVDGYSGASGAYTLTVKASVGYDNWVSWVDHEKVTSTSVAIEQNGGALLQAVKGTDGKFWTRHTWKAHAWPEWWINHPANVTIASTILPLKSFRNMVFSAIRSSTNEVWTNNLWGGRWISGANGYKASSNITLEVFDPGDGKGARLYRAFKTSPTMAPVYAPANAVVTHYTTDGITWDSNCNCCIDLTASAKKAAGDITMSAFGNRLYQATAEYGTNYVMVRGTTNGDDWDAWRVDTKKAAAGSRVALAAFDPNGAEPLRLYRAFRESGTNKVWTSFTEDGITWTTWADSGKTTTFDVAMQAIVNSYDNIPRLYQAITSSGKVLTRYTLDGENWTDWVADGTAASAVTMTAWNDGGTNKLIQAVKGTGNKVWMRFTDMHEPIMTPKPQAEMVTVKKGGDGTGTIALENQVCGLACSELSVPYTEGLSVQLTVTPSADSYFVRWEKADGTVLSNMTNILPGETVVAVFNKK